MWSIKAIANAPVTQASEKLSGDTTLQRSNASPTEHGQINITYGDESHRAKRHGFVTCWGVEHGGGIL